MEAQEVGETPSPDRVAGTSRPPLISYIEVDGVARVRERQADVEPHQVYCSMGIVVSRGEGLEPYIVGAIQDSGAEISCVSEATVSAL